MRSGLGAFAGSALSPGFLIEATPECLRGAGKIESDRCSAEKHEVQLENVACAAWLFVAFFADSSL